MFSIVMRGSRNARRDRQPSQSPPGHGSTRGGSATNAVSRARSSALAARLTPISAERHLPHGARQRAAHAHEPARLRGAADQRVSVFFQRQADLPGVQTERQHQPTALTQAAATQAGAMSAAPTVRMTQSYGAPSGQPSAPSAQCVRTSA